jgi:hypothetical protein
MFSKVFAILAAGVSVVSAACEYPPPLTNQLPGNSVTRPDTLNPATRGVAGDIVWDATGLGDTVTLILLRGPGNNIQYLDTIVSGAPNTGAYSWTPSFSYEADTTHYGIMMINDADCKFQWSSQFGINAGDAPSTSSSVAPSTSTSEAPVSSTTATYTKTRSRHEESSTTKRPQPPSPSDDCDDEEGGDYPKPPKTWSSYGGGQGPWGPPKNGTKTSIHWATGTGAYPSSTYKPIQANDATSFGMSFVGAAGALAAAIMLL